MITTSSVLENMRSSPGITIDGRAVEVRDVVTADELVLIRFTPAVERDMREAYVAGKVVDGSPFYTIGFSTPAEPFIVDGIVRGIIVVRDKQYYELELRGSYPKVEGFGGAPVVVGSHVIGLLDASNVQAGFGATRMLAVPLLGPAYGSLVSRLEASSAAEANIDRELFARLSDGARIALAHADALRRGGGHPKLSIEQLLAGLQRPKDSPARLAFSAAGIDEKRFLELARITNDVHRDWYAYPTIESLPPLSDQTRTALTRASTSARTASIEARDLFDAAMSITDAEIVQTLRQLGVETRPPVQTQTTVASASFGRPANTVAASTTAVADVVAGFRSDGVANQPDLLDIEKDVAALCSVIAARDVEPPLSIGLFGDWGSGKSFFIGEMRKQLGRIASAANAAEQAAIDAKQDPTGATKYCARIAQLDFNAWTYIDTVLWASLTDGIIDGLARAMEDPKQIKTTATERARLLAAAAQSRDVLGQAEARQATAVANLEQQEKVLAAAKERAAAPSRGVAAIKREARIAVVATDAALKQQLEDIGKELGADPKVADAKAMLVELQESWGLAKGIYHAIRGNSVWFVVGAFVLAGVGALSIWFGDQLHTAAKAVIALAGIALALGPYVKKAHTAVRKVKAIFDQHAAAVAEEQKRLTRDEQSRRDLAKVEADAAEKMLAAAKQDLAHIEAQLFALRADQQMMKFLKDRQASEDYRKHFGVIGRARSDFERLSELLSSTNAQVPVDGLPRIDRIVLYIDDLDRCSEQQVVDVLQAVHLLLAFKLFVVVVAVDSRWLLHSLQQHSSAFQSNPDADQGLSEEERLHWRSTPLNYLEKIFQIPFTLRPVGEGGFGKMIDRLTAPLEDKTTAVGTRTDSQPVATQPAQPTPATPAASTGSAATPPEAPAALPQGSVATSSTTSSIDIKPQHLVIEAWEQELMKKFHPLISTPRAIKRFVNVYRLLKARMPDERGLATRGLPSQDDYRAAMFQLALLVGFPSEATDLMRDLSEQVESKDAWWEWLDKFFAGELAKASTGSPQRERLVDLKGRLEAIKHDMADVRLPACDVFRSWTPYVARFSFQAGRLSAASTKNGAGGTAVQPAKKRPRKPADSKAPSARSD